MKEVSRDDVINNNTFYRKCCLICGLYIKKKNVSKNEIARYLNGSVTDEYLCSLLKFLEFKKFLVVDRTRVPHIYNIKGVEIGWFIRKGKEFKINADFPIQASMGWKPNYYG